MSITQLLTASAKTFSTSLRRNEASGASRGEHVRHAPTGDPRLDLAHADRSYR
ncbi:MAG: hypothetical protein ACI81L_001632 [Verrucomicrobiales bacterium]|jgi:hypothetical protein